MSQEKTNGIDNNSQKAQTPTDSTASKIVVEPNEQQTEAMTTQDDK